MARTYAQVYLTIWNDPDFRNVSTDAQWLYFVMLTHPTLTSCGVMDWRPARLIRMSNSMTIPDLQHAAWELGQRRLIAVDPETEEALVRSFVRHDRILASPNKAKALVREHAAIASQHLMALVSAEVRRAGEEEPNLKGLAEANPVAKQFVEGFPKGSEMVPDWFQKGSDSVAIQTPPKQGKGSDSVSPPSPLTPHPSTDVERGAADADTAPSHTTPRAASKKIPLPDDWEPKDRHRAKAKDLGIDLDWEVQKFKNDALAKDKRFVQWDRALDTWLQRAVEYGTRTRSPAATHRSTTDDRVQGWLALANQNDDDDRKELTA